MIEISILPAGAQRRTKADLLILGFFDHDTFSKQQLALEPKLPDLAGPAVKNGRFSGEFAKSFYVYHPQCREAAEILLLGLGSRKTYRQKCFRKAIGEMVRQIKDRQAHKARLHLDSFVHGEVKEENALEILAAVTGLSFYDFDKYKSAGKKKKSGGSVAVEVLTADTRSLKTKQLSLQTGEAVARGILLARDLVNEPGNIMSAAKLAETARKMAQSKKLSCRVLGEREIRSLKMGGILAVNQGSVTPPALIVLEYGSAHKGKGTVCLVGKGVTFDTGGISIKPAKDMEKMKYDMAGAAAVIGTLSAIADLKPKLHVVGIAPAVENNVANDPQRPGDIIRMFNGKTVEVLNTDAEGRLILADALAYAEKYKPDAIIDLATLTGMCAYTFGDKAIGLMGTDPKLVQKVQKAGEASGERCWELPLWEDYAEQIKGHHSDLLNIGGPYAGTITAAMFLKEFVPEKTSWVHLDIAGTAWANSARYDCVKGGTGVGVQLLCNLLMNWR